MFTRCYADNYRCLSNFTLPLEPLSVLLGANGSGKSTVFFLIAKLRDFILGRGNSLELFPPETLTRWDKRIEQTFELGLRLGEGEYIYRLRVKHEAPERALNKVIEETLNLNGQPLFAADDQIIHLYIDSHKEGGQMLPDWHVSGISRINERRDNLKLMAFRRAIEGTLVLALNPALVSAVSAEKQPVTIPMADCSDFAGWLKYISTAEALARQEAEQSLAKGGLPGFRLFQAVRSGDAEILECVFQPKLKFRLDELSSGQIALVILETAVAVAGERNGVLILDEPANFLGLGEIQPLLARLQDAALEGRFQVLLTAHHPIAVDFLAAGYGSWLEREPSGPTRVQPIRVAESVEGDKAGIRVSDLIARGWLSAIQSGSCSEVQILGFKAITTKNESGVAVRYACEIEIKNLDDHEAAKGVTVRLASIEPKPREFEASQIASPHPTDFPIRLEPKDGTPSIAPGSDLRFELFKLIRRGPLPTIEIAGNGKIYRQFNPEVKSRDGQTQNIVSYHNYQFTLDVAADNRRATTWRIDLKFVGDAKGIPTVEVEKAERIT